MSTAVQAVMPALMQNTNTPSSLKSKSKVEEDVNFLLLYMSGGTFFIKVPLYEKIKKHVDLFKYIDIEESKKLFTTEEYPRGNLGNNIALRWVGDIGFGKTSIVSSEQLKEIILNLHDINPNLARDFYNEMIYLAFYGARKTSSY